MIESTYVKEFESLPEGHYKLFVVGKPAKVESGKTHYRDWNFVTDDDRKLNLRIYPWEAKELLIAVGGKLKDQDHVEWDDEKVDAAPIEADLEYAEYKKKDGTMGKKVVLRNVKEGIPF